MTIHSILFLSEMGPRLSLAEDTQPLCLWELSLKKTLQWMSGVTNKRCQMFNAGKGFEFFMGPSEK